MPDSSESDLGEAIQKALAQSRFLKLEELDDFFNLERVTTSYAAWVTSLLERYGYKTRRALFKSMALCHITVTGEKMEIVHMRHEKLEGWAGLGIERTSENVALPSTSEPELIGRALKTAFERCE